MPGPFPSKSVVLIPSDGADGILPQTEAMRVNAAASNSPSKVWGVDASGAHVQATLADLASTSKGFARINLRRWQKAAALVRAGAARTRLVCIGDSKTQGFGAGSNLAGAGASAGASPKSWPDLLAGMLTARGLPASRDSCFGNKGLAAYSDFAAYDPRNTGGSTGWGYAYVTLGGYGWQNSTNSNPRSFQPAGQVDTVEIYSRGQANSRVFTVTLDADPTVIGTYDLVSATEVIVKNTPTFTLGAHKINIQRTSGQGVTTLGLIAYNSAAPAVDVINAGWRGSVSADHAAPSNPLSAINMLAAISPGLVVIQIGTNDLNTSVTAATYKANVEQLIVAAQAAGADVLLMYPTVGSPGYGSAALRAAYRQALIDLGSAYGCEVIDAEQEFNGYSSNLFYDSVHENYAGNQYLAAAVASRVLV
ncbi:SGNH/GDSL hydrolase family protein [Xanthobacter sp. V3C-3]|uniref:SGNH/GDSL hydrolase family protein n=1 Tax=Xanthobacter lutulentifluminis TaxID=3119935 RepID=UPI0037295BAD